MRTTPTTTLRVTSAPRDIHAHIVKTMVPRASLRCALLVLLSIPLPCGCQLAPLNARPAEPINASLMKAHPISAPTPTVVHIKAVALVGPILELRYIKSNTVQVGVGDGVVHAAPLRGERANAPCEIGSGRRLHLLLSLDGLDTAVEHIASFIQAPEDMTPLVDVFDASTGKRLTPTAQRRPMKWSYDASEFAHTQPPRAAWDQKLATNTLVLRVLVLPIDLELPPSSDGRVRVSLAPMAAMFRARTHDDATVMVDTRPVELGAAQR